jgi:hypothetical protein
LIGHIDDEAHKVYQQGSSNEPMPRIVLPSSPQSPVWAPEIPGSTTESERDEPPASSPGDER